MTVDEAFKKAFPDMPENYPLRTTLKGYFAAGFEAGQKVESTSKRRKWQERSVERAPSTFPTGPLKLQC